MTVPATALGVKLELPSAIMRMHQLERDLSILKVSGDVQRAQLPSESQLEHSSGTQLGPAHVPSLQTPESHDDAAFA